MDTFQQILDLDDDTHEFSKGMAWAYFSQAEDTFKEMDGALYVTEATSSICILSFQFNL